MRLNPSNENPMTRPDEPNTLQIQQHSLGRTLVLTLAGAADATCVDVLEQELNKVGSLHPQHIIIDLTRLSSIAALVNATLSMFANDVRHHGGDVRYVMQPTRQVA